MDPEMFEGQKRVIFSTSNFIGGKNSTTYAFFFLLGFLLLLASVGLLFLSKRNLETKQISTTVGSIDVSCSLEESPSMISQSITETEETS